MNLASLYDNMVNNYHHFGDVIDNETIHQYLWAMKELMDTQ